MCTVCAQEIAASVRKNRRDWLGYARGVSQAIHEYQHFIHASDKPVFEWLARELHGAAGMTQTDAIVTAYTALIQDGSC